MEVLSAYGAGHNSTAQPVEDMAHARGRLEFCAEHRARRSLVVVASLLDKVPNLAGLTRTCEIFSAERLVVGDLKIVDDKIFQAVSVSAHLWMPMEEVRPANVPAYLLRMKREGYAVLALEQTAHSCPLTDFTFPEKVVLVLGREKEGVPVDFLPLIDQCIEIPQFGVIRSLNVHVSAAVLIWEYTKERLAAH